MQLCYSEYEKVFIQTVYNSSSLTQTWGESQTFWEFMNESHLQLQRNPLQPTSNPTYLFGFENSTLFWIQNYLFLYNLNYCISKSY